MCRLGVAKEEYIYIYISSNTQKNVWIGGGGGKEKKKVSWEVKMLNWGGGKKKKKRMGRVGGEKEK